MNKQSKLVIKQIFTDIKKIYKTFIEPFTPWPSGQILLFSTGTKQKDRWYDVATVGQHDHNAYKYNLINIKYLPHLNIILYKKCIRK